MIEKPDFLKLLTDTFDNISHDNSIAKLHNSITEVVPSRFSELQNCGLMNNLLTQIVTLANNINENSNSFKAQIDLHKEKIVSAEYNLTNELSNLPNVEINNPLEDSNINISSNSRPNNNFYSETVTSAEQETSVNSVSDKNISSFSEVDKTPSTAQQSSRLEQIRNVVIDGENQMSETVASAEQETPINSVSDKNISSFGVADITPSRAQQSSGFKNIRNVEIDGEI